MSRGSTGRLLYDRAGPRLWDPSGTEHALVEHELEREVIEALLVESDVQVAVYTCGEPLRWVAPAERAMAWRDEISPNFHDVRDWEPPRDAPGQLPFEAQLWSDGGGSRVLLFTDRC